MLSIWGSNPECDMTIWKQIRHINIILPEELLARIDEAAKAELQSRSEFIRQALLKIVLEHKTNNIFTEEDKNPKWLDVDDS